MKLYLTLTLSFFLIENFYSISYCQTVKAPVSGIHYTAGTFKQAQQAAKLQQKPLFIKVYLTGCPHCEALAPVFTEKAVGSFYNTNFVNWQIEANQAESKVLQNQLGISYPEFPLLLFLSADGSIIHLATPAEQPNRSAFVEEVIKHAKRALDPGQRSSSYAARFVAGEQELGFLIQAGKYWKATRDTSHMKSLNEAFAQILIREQAMVTPIGLYVLHWFINDFQNPLAQYFFKNLTQFKARLPVKDVLEAGENVLYNSLYGPKVSQWTPADIQQMRQAMISLGTNANEAQNRTLVPELEAYLRANQTTNALERVEAYCQENPRIDAGSYAYFMSLFNLKASDASYLPLMPKWAEAGFQQLKTKSDPTILASLHYELAIAQQKEGKREAASENARKGLEFAKSSKQDLTRYQQLLSSLL
ncbi:hypothetical protein GCM10027592_62880 [Spirosoma flavus]